MDSAIAAVDAGPSEVDDGNRAAWQRPDVVEHFARLDVWTEDCGEAVAIERISGALRDGRVLDIGIGGGRTVPVLGSTAAEYVGIDYTPAMVDAARRRFPSVRIEHMDARDLSAFRTHSFDVVFFSANGIDAVDHVGRRAVLTEAHRVLAPGGVFVYSTHNLEHKNAGRAPWDPRQRWPRDPRRVLRRFARLPLAIRGHLKSRRKVVRGEGWAMLNTPLYDFGLVIHYITLAEARREITAAGFESTIEVIDMNGEMIGDGDDPSTTKWFHIIARVPTEHGA